MSLYRFKAVVQSRGLPYAVLEIIGHAVTNALFFVIDDVPRTFGFRRDNPLIRPAGIKCPECLGSDGMHQMGCSKAGMPSGLASGRR